MTLKNQGRKPVRFTGQHFMCNPPLIQQMIREARIDENDMVLDIGAGKGALTSPLSRRAKRVIAIEQDTRLVSYLRQAFASQHQVKVIGGDFRSIPMPNDTFKIVSNIPFAITTSLFGRLMDNPGTPFLQGVFIIEWGAAKKFTDWVQADPRIVGWNTWFDLDIIRRVAPRAFSPPPTVSSAMLKICRRQSSVNSRHVYNYMAFVASLLKQPDIYTGDVLKRVFTWKQIKRLTADTGINPHDPVKNLRIAQWEHCFNTMCRLVPECIYPAMPGKYKKLYKK